MVKPRWDDLEVAETLAPLLALRQTIEVRARLRPSAVMLPLTLAPHIDTAYGMPVIRGDRAALLYEGPS